MNLRAFSLLSVLVLHLSGCISHDAPFPSQFKRLIATAEEGAILDPSAVAHFRWDRLYILASANYPDAAIKDLHLRANAGVWLDRPAEPGSVFLFVRGDLPVQAVFVPEWVATCSALRGVGLSPADARFLVSGKYQGHPPRSLALAAKPSLTSHLSRPTYSPAPVA